MRLCAISCANGGCWVKQASSPVLCLLCRHCARRVHHWAHAQSVQRNMKLLGCRPSPQARGSMATQDQLHHVLALFLTCEVFHFACVSVLWSTAKFISSVRAEVYVHQRTVYNTGNICRIFPDLGHAEGVLYCKDEVRPGDLRISGPLASRLCMLIA